MGDPLVYSLTHSPPPPLVRDAGTQTQTQTHADIHGYKHMQTYTDTCRHTQTQTQTHRHTHTGKGGGCCCCCDCLGTEVGDVARMAPARTGDLPPRGEVADESWELVCLASTGGAGRGGTPLC